MIRILLHKYSVVFPILDICRCFRYKRALSNSRQRSLSGDIFRDFN